MRLFPAPQGPGARRLYLLGCLLAVLLAYLPLMDNRFVNWDDSDYILFNLPIRHLNLDSLKWIFTHFHAGLWIPLTWLSLALDFAVGRLEPWVYHLDNLLLHGVNTALVFGLSLKMEDIIKKAPGAAETALGTALFFGLHPLHVESVAWASERKDLLCGLFFLLSLWAYLDYAVQPARKGWNYAACLGFFILALLSKPMAVSLPLVLLLLDFWPLQRLQARPGQTLLEKVPFLLTGLAVGLVTLHSANGSMGDVPLSFRLMNACHSLVFYLAKMVFPFNLAALYPILLHDTFSAAYVASALGVFFISAMAWIYRRKAPGLLAAWLFYVITLAPALGLLQAGNQAAGDRFTYLPSLAPFFLAAALLVRICGEDKKVLLACYLALSAFLGWGTSHQLPVWRNTVALWENVVRCYPENNLVVFQNLGKAYEENGRLDQAREQYVQAAAGFNFFYPHWGLARVAAATGRLDEAVREYKAALAMNPNLPPLHSGLAMAYEKKGMGQEALAEAQKAVQLDKTYADGYLDLGLLYRGRKQWPKALEAFRAAWVLDPDNADYFRNLVRCYALAGDPKDALALYRKLSQNPRSLLTMYY